MLRIIRKIIQILDGTPAEYGEQGQGQAVVELALIMPILLVMLAGIVEMGWFTNNYLIVLEATRVGSRLGTILEAQSGPIAWERESVRIDDLTPPYDLRTRAGVYPMPVNNAGQDWYFLRDARIDNANGVLDANEGNVCSQGIFQIGFYTRIACTTLSALAPVDDEFYLWATNTGDDQSSNDDFVPGGWYQPDDQFALPVPRNDIIVSAFSLNRVPRAIQTCVDNPGTCDTIDARIASVAAPFRDSSEDTEFLVGAPLNDNGTPNNESDDFSDSLSAQIMVTGRYPSNANECDVDLRDPFDINNNNALDTWEIDELRQVILNDGYTLMDSGAASTTDKNVRGFSLTGRWMTQDGCIGSEWGVRRIEKLVNLSGVYESEMQQLPEQQGLVLVEVMYRHDLLLDLPLFGGIFNMFGAGGGEDTGYITVWAAFPLPSVRFNLDFERNCNDLLLFDTVDDPDYSLVPQGSGGNCTLIAS